MKANKEEYLEARKEFEFFIQELIVRLSLWDSRFEYLEPKDCIFRLNRDIRFSDNKKPYKENFAAFFGVGGKKSTLPGYYVSISPKEIFAGGGLWQPEADKLIKVRRFVVKNGIELKAIEGAKSFKKNFGTLSDEDKLKRVPKGFDADHPMADYLKLKSFIASREFTTAEAIQKNFGKEVDKTFQALKPLNDYLLRSLQASYILD